MCFCGVVAIGLRQSIQARNPSSPCCLTLNPHIIICDKRLILTPMFSQRGRYQKHSYSNKKKKGENEIVWSGKSSATRVLITYFSQNNETYIYTDVKPWGYFSDCNIFSSMCFFHFSLSSQTPCMIFCPTSLAAVAQRILKGRQWQIQGVQQVHMHPLLKI